MNRAERRRQEREARKHKVSVPATVNQTVLKRFTKEEFEQFIFDIDYQARLETINMMMTAFTLAEHRVHKFGHTRLKRTLDYVDQMMDDVINKKATWEQYLEECVAETGWKFINKPEDAVGGDADENHCG